MNWVEACHDKRLQNLPYKVELDRHGKIIMSPTRNKRGFYQAEIAHLLKQLMPGGQVITECAIDTPEGTFVADAVWASLDRFKIIEDEFSCSVAPEICVEVWSPSNSTEEIEMKKRLYFEKGAQEFWYCDAKGLMTHFDRSGKTTHSGLCPKFPKKIG